MIMKKMAIIFLLEKKSLIISEEYLITSQSDNLVKLDLFFIYIYYFLFDLGTERLDRLNYKGMTSYNR